jgi:hypothetical protein
MSCTISENSSGEHPGDLPAAGFKDQQACGGFVPQKRSWLTTTTAPGKKTCAGSIT